MENKELTYRKDGDKRLKRVFIQGVRSAGKEVLRKVGPFAMAVLMSASMSFSSNTGEESYNSQSMQGNAGIENTHTIKQSSDFVELKKRIDIEGMVDNIVEGRDFVSFLEKHSDVRIDLANVVFSNSDLALVRGKESKISKQLMAVADRVTRDNGEPTGRCLAQFKKMVRKMPAILNGLSVDEKIAFYNEGSACNADKYLDKCSDWVKLHICEQDWNKLPASDGYIRLRKAGETQHGHIEPGGVAGVYYDGRGLQKNTPKGHINEYGGIDEYGELISYCHKGTFMTLMRELGKQYPDKFIGVYDKTANSLVLMSSDDIPEGYKTLVAEYHQMKEEQSERLQMFADDLIAVQDATLVHKITKSPELAQIEAIRARAGEVEEANRGIIAQYMSKEYKTRVKSHVSSKNSSLKIPSQSVREGRSV